MVRLSDLIDLNEGGTTRKFLSDKRNEGEVAPRNRLEQQVEASPSFCIEGDSDLLCTYHMTNDWSENNCYFNEAPMKKLISEELSRSTPNSGQNAPSVVARLMGLDMLSVDTKPSTKKVEKKNEMMDRHPPREEWLRKGSFDHRTHSSIQKNFNSFDHNEACNIDRRSKSLKLNKLKPREHPQEEELQKFKKEFEAWQATRFKECSKFVEFGTNTDQWLAQRRLNKEKLVLYANSKRLDVSSTPTKIVILRPVCDRTGDSKESRASSPGISEDGSSIEEFLQEVKERLKCELHEKSLRRSTTVIGTSYTEKPSEAKKIAQSIAKQVRESVTRDVGTTLPRSKSMRSYRSEIQCDANGSSEFTNRDKRRFLEKSRAEESRYIASKVRHRDDMKDHKSDMQSRYFRQELSNDVMLDQELFHRNLVRSLSAPVSRSSFGKLLLEDQHMLTGAHIRRKHEASEKVKINIKTCRKEKFNLREKVSSFKYSFVLKGKLFGRKIQSLEESNGNKQVHMKDLLNTPTVASKFHENSTEVPPSPASVCSTTNEEFWRQTDCCSLSSTSDIHPPDDSEMCHVFKEISSNLNELRRKLNQLETYDSEESMIDEQSVEEEIMEIDDPAESFVRDLLVASGLYDGSCDKYLSKWDPFGKPVSNQVFEEVETSYKKKRNDIEEACTSDQFQKFNHKLLCDFMNEMLPDVLGVPSTVLSYMKSTIVPTARPLPLRGKKLLDCVWEIARVYVYPSSDMSSQSLETILARDLQSMPWTGLVDEDVNAVGKDIEYQIIGDLIHDMINDMQP
ncbi:uncharacterized protein [Nicotiana sylvestris]|nr:PREDICTED: uncharacterized protein LOC104240839 isoform X2 [Nicotiana sylvestris]XP_009794030.1 PREDICTED: uncharacterized protein LOC104240839 isoform X2 [Nicotiana sylvestris]XP_009794032.1 PREDICTED: uncharacterized protein LOC104240839 isoform X2 [Nicotiana sylvestris]